MRWYTPVMIAAAWWLYASFTAGIVACQVHATLPSSPFSAINQALGGH